jgi:hypothetical protein
MKKCAIAKPSKTKMYQGQFPMIIGLLTIGGLERNI